MENTHEKQLEDFLNEIRSFRIKIPDQNALLPYSSPEGFPKILFHYTSPEGLLGIFSTKNVWASNLRYMNDSSEITYAYDLIQEILTRYIGHPEYEEFSKGLTDFNKEIDVSKNIIFNAYAFCMCEDEGDSLSQWREYGSRGIGYSLGFPYLSLKKIASDNNYELLPVIYNRSEQMKILEKVIIKMKDFATGSKDDFLPLLLLREGFRLFVPQIKNPAFKEEREWRLVSNGRFQEVKFRAARNFIIPYMEFNFDFGNRLPVAVVTQGPQANPGIAISSVHSLAYKYDPHRSDVSIRTSKVPFRF